MIGDFIPTEQSLPAEWTNVVVRDEEGNISVMYHAMRWDKIPVWLPADGFEAIAPIGWRPIPEEVIK